MILNSVKRKKNTYFHLAFEKQGTENIEFSFLDVPIPEKAT